MSERVGVAVTVLIRILEVLGSYLGRDMAILAEEFRGLPQSLYTNTGIPSLGSKKLFPNYHSFFRSRGEVGIATGYGLDDRDV
jgi:hypothetical protein